MEHEGCDNYTEAENNTCPCDLGDYEAGEARINEIVEDVAESVANQQALLDEEYYLPMLSPEAAATYTPIVATDTVMVGDEVDDYSYTFLDGTEWAADRIANVDVPIGDICEDDLSTADSFGDDCTWYYGAEDGCGYYDTAEFSAMTQCCACATM